MVSTDHMGSNSHLWPGLLIPRDADAALAAELARLTPEAWTGLINSAARHQLLGMLAWRLKQPTLAPVLPYEVRSQLNALQRSLVIQSLTRQAELHRALHALASVDVHPVLFKGALLAHTIYPTPECRSMGDIDLWVTEDEMPQARQALTALGYRQQASDIRPEPFQSLTDGEIQFIGQKHGQGLIELHWGVFAGDWLRWAAKIDRAEVRRRIMPLHMMGVQVYRLNAEDGLIQVAAHLAIGHQFSGTALRSLLDVALLAQQGLDWELVARRVQAWELRTVVGFTCALVAELFRLPELEPGRALLPISAQRSRVVQHFIDAKRILANYDLSQSSQRLLYLLSIVDRPGAMVRLSSGSLWPDRDWLKRLYGQSTLRTRLHHALVMLLREI